MKYPPRLEKVVFPEELKPSLQLIVERIKKAPKRERPWEEGPDIGPVPDEIRGPYLLFLWLGEINEIIDNLNLILDDLAQAGEGLFIYDELPKTRLRLLVRTFYRRRGRWQVISKEGTLASYATYSPIGAGLDGFMQTQ